LKKLLVEKYRPSSLEGYVFNNPETERKVKKWTKEGEIPNMLLSGSAGCGKSTLARILVNEMGIQESDVYRVNASLENGIGFIRERLEPWCKKASFSSFKVVILEESDMLSHSAMKSLRDIVEAYSDTVRWIFTCNYPEKIIPALHSRLQNIHIDSHGEDGVINLILDIIEAENITVNDEEDVLSHIDAYIPDIRKIINSIDEHTDADNVLHKLSGAVDKGVDAEGWVSLWNSEGSLDVEAAMVLTGAIDLNNFESFYEIMYANSHKFPDEDRGIVLLSKYLDRALRAANQRLHLKAFLIEAFLMEDSNE
jgi:DNA polymerase III delta prime subunit